MNLRSDRRGIRGWHVALALLAILAICFGVFRVAVRVRLRSRMNAVRVAGYPLALAELDAWYEEPGLAENAADYVTEAFTRLRIPEGEERQSLPLFGRTESLPRTQSLDQEIQARIDKLLAENAEALDLLHQVAAIERSRFPIDLSRGHSTLMPHLAEISKAARLLALEAITHASHNDGEQAARSIVSGYALARSLLHEPLPISQTVRHSCDITATEALERVLSKTQVSEEQLQKIDRAIQTAYDPNALTRALVAERCLGHAAFRNPRSLGLQFISHIGEPSLLLVEVRRATGTLGRSWATYLDLMQECIGVAQLPSPRRLRAAEAIEVKYRALPRNCSLVHYVMPPTAGLVSVDLADMGRLLTARTAVAVERYRLAMGRLPEQLSDLVPRYMEAIPSDPFDGLPLRYRLLENGYIVYSVGRDETDDGGTERPAKRYRQGQTNHDITFIVEQ